MFAQNGLSAFLNGNFTLDSFMQFLDALLG